MWYLNHWILPGIAILLHELVYHNHVDHFEEIVVQFELLEHYRLQQFAFSSVDSFYASWVT